MMKKDELRKLAEKKVSDITDKLDALTPEQIKKTFYELTVHQIELEMQNEELTRSQLELDAVRERYFDLYDLAPVGYITISEKGLILEVNLKAASMLGLTRKDPVNNPISRYILKEDQDIYYKHCKLLIKTGRQQSFEMRMVKKDETLFWVQLETNIAQDANGELLNRVMINDITGRKAAEEQIRSLLAEKEIILKEVHHRIKNNMNTIHGLLYLQADIMKVPEAREALTVSASRVQSMMVLYDKLYRSDDVQNIYMKNYLPSLIDEIISNFPNNKKVKIENKIGDFKLDAKRLMPLGLIINELLSNIMKYAFTGREEGLITVEAKIVNSGLNSASTISFIIKDNGNGIPESVNFDNSTGFGLHLVSMLTKELKGSIRIERENGTRIVLEFEM